MSWSLRRILVVLTAVAVGGTLACLPTAFAQRRGRVVAGPIIITPGMPVQPNPGGSADAASFDLPRDTDARRHIEAARDYIDAKRWPEVAEALQHVLNDRQDKFAPLLRKGPDGKEIEVPTSVRAEANRLLAGLPPEGLEVYKAYKDAGPAAAEYLQKAKSADSTEERLSYLGLVVRNYLHTDAGGEAADLLATHFMDAGDFRTAARYYGLLLTRAGGADVMPPDALFRAAYAFRQVGDKADEDLMWQTARGRGIREIKLGDETRTISELQDYLAAIAPPADPVAHQWNYFGGDVSHTGRGDGGPAFMWRIWNYDTSIPADSPMPGALSAPSDDFSRKTADLFKKASDKLTGVHQPVLSPQFPVAGYVTTKEGKKLSLVVYRSHSGIVARNLDGGKTIGYSPIEGSLEWMMDPSRQSALSQWTQIYIDQGVRPGIVFENTTTGTLSIDGDFAYTVADLAVPKPPTYRFAGAFPGQPQQNFGWSADIVEWIKSNRLAAFDLSSGCRSVWQPEVFTDPKSELSGCFFLGPPLAVNGKLYVLSEKQQELRLICLENIKGDGVHVWKPQIDFVLPLGVSRDSKLEDDSLRRINAAHLSYGEGVLVCPTNLGYVIGIDLLQNSLLWAYPYRDKTDVAANALPPGARILPGGLIIGPNGQQIQPTLPQQGWRSSAPIIQDGKVVFTAYDSNSIHCINLKDGSPVWSKPRQEGDLYLGGVVDGKAIVVGQKVVRAYNLSNGEKPWEAVETGEPTGFGAASDNVYYVPLAGFGGGKDAEICAIDVDHGVVVGHSKAHVPPDHKADEAGTPGNLIFFDGAIISQNNDAVTAYPQMKVKVAEMNDRLNANPNDLEGLFDRGEMNLEQGDKSLENAVQDFRTVLHAAPAGELQSKAREKLYYTLTQYFQHHFNQAEKYQADYAALCSTDLPAAATEADKAEARRRRTKYLCLVAEGKEDQRKLTEAFDLYMQVNAEAPPDVLLPEVDEPMVKAAPDVLVQGRIAAMVASASEEERKPLEARIAARWKDIQARNDPAELRQFVAMFGSLFTVGQEARLRLAEQLLNDDRDESLIDAERQLSLLRARTQDPDLAARAVECLARLNTRKGLLEDAAYYYRVLRDRYPDVKVIDGKTGADLFNEAASDKRLWANLDDPPRLGLGGKIAKPEEERDNYNYSQNQSYEFTHEGDPLPFYQRYRLGLYYGTTSLKLVDRTTHEARWAPIAVNGTMFQSIVLGNLNMNPQPVFVPGLLQVNTQPAPTPECSYMTLGHLAVVPVGNIIVGLDLVHGKEMWRKNLLDQVNGPPAGAVPQPQEYSLTVDPRDGSVQIVYQEGWTQHLGRVGPLEGAAVCLQMRDALTAVDPVSGRVLWTRSDVSSSSRLFGDDQHVFVVEMAENGKPASNARLPHLRRRHRRGARLPSDLRRPHPPGRPQHPDGRQGPRRRDAAAVRPADGQGRVEAGVRAEVDRHAERRGRRGGPGRRDRAERPGARRRSDHAQGGADGEEQVRRRVPRGQGRDLHRAGRRPGRVPRARRRAGADDPVQHELNAGLRPPRPERQRSDLCVQEERRRAALALPSDKRAAGAEPVRGDADGADDGPVAEVHQRLPARRVSLEVADRDRQEHRQSQVGVRTPEVRRVHRRPFARQLQRRPVLQPGGEQPQRHDRVHRAAEPDRRPPGEQPAGAAVRVFAAGV